MIFGKEQDLTERFDFKDSEDIKSVLVFYSSANDLRGLEMYDRHGNIIVTIGNQ